ncbi:MAG: efflux RND transporter periplasmic adaptor subunit, partial [Bacteroidota bacterium]
QATIGSIDNILSYTGNVEGINEAFIISQTSGVVKKINFTIGRRYGAGAVLAVIENTQQQAGVEQAKATVLAAEQNYEKAKLDLSRIQKLFESKAVSQEQTELAELGVKSALAQFKGAQAGLKVAEKQLADTYIKATIGGYASNKFVDLGGTVGQGARVAQIVDISKFKIKIMVAENDAVKLQTGRTVTVKIDAIPGKDFKGKINSIGLSTENGLRSYPVEVLMENNGKNEIKSGMFARCEIFVESKNDALIVPDKAVIMQNDGSTQVFVIENGKAVLTNVKLGIKSLGKYEILSGLTVSSKIVVEGKERLTNGVIVKEINK